MTENVTEGHDWMVPALIFARTIQLILEENQGIVVNLNENTKIEGFEDVKQVIVYRKNEQIHIAPSEDEFPEGTPLNLEINEKTE